MGCWAPVSDESDLIANTMKSFVRGGWYFREG